MSRLQDVECGLSTVRRLSGVSILVFLKLGIDSLGGGIADCRWIYVQAENVVIKLFQSEALVAPEHDGHLP